ncbi:hypothetical protein GCM10010994_52820 [Chelatococcus reniformis]|uniref:Transposase IS200-like domain-containing protein n=1 Tax=Chelatococcus reniformis TaxID=1494448 RepID=A0A916UV76_9HYPH|nr:hypothetical protein GCM10010994_52820 [Chelatococcus reniformis]
MSRIARVVVPGLAHHVTQRGNRREQVFFGEDDYRAYLDLLSFYARAGTQLIAWCLMPNHVHLVAIPAHEDGLRAMLGETHRRDECLNEHMFRNLPSARRLIEEWRTGYNAHRPHTSLGLTPNEFATRSRTDHSENRIQL